MEFLQIVFLGIGLVSLLFLSCIFFDIAYNDFQHEYIDYHANRIKLLVIILGISLFVVSISARWS